MPVDVEKRSCLSIMLGLRANTCRLGFKAVVTMRATRYGFNYPWVKCPSMWKNGSTMRDKVPTQAPCRCETTMCAANPAERRADTLRDCSNQCETTMCAANPAERRADTLRDCSNQTSLPSAIPKTSFSCATSKKEISKGSTGDRVNTCNQGYPP